MRLAIAVLALLNLVLLAVWGGLVEPLLGNGREPQRLLRQVRPERLRIAQVGWQALPAAAREPSDAAAAASALSTPPSAGSGPPDAEASRQPGETPAAARSSPAFACVEWGAFSAVELPRARQAAESTGVRTETVHRPLESGAFIVYLPSAPDQAAAQARVSALKRAGIDGYVLHDGPYRWAISLGVFRSEPSAQALRQALSDRGLTEARVGVRGPESWALRLHSAVPLPPDRQQALSAGFSGRTLRPCST